MKKYDFDEYVKNKPKFLAAALRLKPDSSRARRSSSGNRDKAEEKFLIKLDIERWSRWQKCGKIKILAPRKFIYNL